MIQLRLEREPRAEQHSASEGKLYLNDVFECYTLEDIERDVKIKHETAIPRGTYKVSITHSPRFGRELPLLHDVPGFAGIRIHPGNTDADTSGCILVGRVRAGEDLIAESRKAFDALFLKLSKAQAAEEAISITIV